MRNGLSVGLGTEDVTLGHQLLLNADSVGQRLTRAVGDDGDFRVLEVELVHPTAHHPDDKGSNEGAKDPAAASKEARASDHHGSDNLELKAGAHHGGGGIHPGGFEATQLTPSDMYLCDGLPPFLQR